MEGTANHDNYIMYDLPYDITTYLVEYINDTVKGTNKLLSDTIVITTRPKDPGEISVVYVRSNGPHVKFNKIEEYQVLSMFYTKHANDPGIKIIKVTILSREKGNEVTFLDMDRPMKGSKV